MDPKVIAKRLRNALTRRRRKQADADKGPAYAEQVEKGYYDMAVKGVYDAIGRRIGTVARRNRRVTGSKYDPRECRARGCR